MFFLAKYNTQTTFYFAMVKRGVVDLAASADWTPATGDTKISKDGGNFANTTNNPAAIGGTGSVGWSLTLTAAELSAGVINIQIVDSASKAVEDQYITIYTFGNASAKIVPDWSDAVRMGLTALPNAAAEAAGGLFTRGTGAGQINQPDNGRIDASVGAYQSGQAPLQPTVAGRTLDVSAGGEAGLDWANIGSPTTIVGLSGTSVKTATDVETDTQDIQSRLPAALVGGKIDASIGAVANNAITDAGVSTDMDTYHATIWVVKESTTVDHYAVIFFKNGQPITSGITSPTIQVIKASDGTDLVVSTALTEVGSLGIYKKDETSNKLVGGAIYFAKVVATIDGSSRTWLQQIGRDSV